MGHDVWFVAEPAEEEAMGDPEAEADAIGDAQDQTPPPDPARQLDSDAWFAEFLSENAEKLELHNREALDEVRADRAAANARHDRELELAQEHHQFHGSADARLAAMEDELAAKAEAAVADAEAGAKRLEAEFKELYPIAIDHANEARIRHDQAQALERAAADERESRALSHPGEEDANR
jgi:hypothetical protein